MSNFANKSNTIFVANCTQQHQIFQYATKMGGPLIPITIKMGGQARLPGELTGMEVAFIEKQFRPYGLRRLDEIKDIKNFVGLILNVGEPIPVGEWRDLIEHNRNKLKERGAELRKESAVAAAESVSGNNPEFQVDPNSKLQALEVEIVEEDKKDGRDTELNETIRVTNNKEEAEQGAKGRRGRGR